MSSCTLSRSQPPFERRQSAAPPFFASASHHDQISSALCVLRRTAISSRCRTAVFPSQHRRAQYGFRRSVSPNSSEELRIGAERRSSFNGLVTFNPLSTFAMGSAPQTAAVGRIVEPPMSGRHLRRHTNAFHHCAHQAGLPLETSSEPNVHCCHSRMAKVPTERLSISDAPRVTLIWRKPAYSRVGHVPAGHFVSSNNKTSR